MEPDIRDIVPMVKIEPIVVPEPLERTRAKLDILKNYLGTGDFPMSGNFTKPRNAAVFHFGVSHT